MKVFCTGSSGYIGSALVPLLIKHGHKVVAFDIGWFWTPPPMSDQTVIKGDIRDMEAVKRAMEGCDAVINLSAISNDPSCDLAPSLAKSVNADSFGPMLLAAKEQGVRRFITASSASVYGVAEGEVTEERECAPITDYARYKSECDITLFATAGIERVSLRPATVSGYAHRQRLDLVANILTSQAVNEGTITVLGGTQMRPLIHIDDMCRAYLTVLEAPADKVDGQIFNVGDDNYTVSALAELVRDVIGHKTQIITKPSTDNRSYRLNSEKIKRVLGFHCQRSTESAIADLAAAFKAGKIPDYRATIYRNVERMKELNVT